VVERRKPTFVPQELDIASTPLLPLLALLNEAEHLCAPVQHTHCVNNWDESDQTQAASWAVPRTMAWMKYKHKSTAAWRSRGRAGKNSHIRSSCRDTTTRPD
jgi:hypothetical protein